ncbi:hypothetical protein SXANM310S_03947 [Streptomyces xanthochromogenes]
MPQLSSLKVTRSMAFKVMVVIAWAIMLVTINEFLIDAYWGELVVTGVCSGAMAFCLNRVDRTRR